MRRLRASSAAAATLALAAGAVAVPAVALGGAHAATGHTVTLKAVRFHPGTLTIHRGDSVTWEWRDNERHNVTFSGFHSKTMSHGSYTVRFTHTGTFSYKCTLHVREGMKGTIIVH